MNEEITLKDFLSIGQNAMASRVVQHEDATDNYNNDFMNVGVESQASKILLRRI